jgi:hypothetical protein
MMLPRTNQSPRPPRSGDRGWKARVRRFSGAGYDEADPLLGVVNLFDASMVLVVALLLALAGTTSLADVAARLSHGDITIVSNPGSPDMEILIKRGNKIEKLRQSDQPGAGRGERLGTAYRLDSGEVVYVPDQPLTATPATDTPVTVTDGE